MSPLQTKYSGRDPKFAQALRAEIGLAFDDLVTVGTFGPNTQVCLATRDGNYKLVLIFENLGTHAVNVRPVIVDANGVPAPWQGTPLDARALIDALDSLWFRRITPPKGRMQ
jgi:hypothetical protein